MWSRFRHQRCVPSSYDSWTRLASIRQWRQHPCGVSTTRLQCWCRLKTTDCRIIPRGQASMSASFARTNVVDITLTSTVLLGDYTETWNHQLLTPTALISWLTDVTPHTLSHPPLLSHDLLTSLVTPCHTHLHQALHSRDCWCYLSHSALLSHDLLMLLVTPCHTQHSLSHDFLTSFITPCHSYLVTWWCYLSHPLTPGTPISWLCDVTCHPVTPSTPVSWLAGVTCHTLSYPALTVSRLSDVIYHTLSLLPHDLVMLLVTPTHTRHSYFVTWWCYLSHPLTQCTPISWLGDVTCHTVTPSTLVSWLADVTLHTLSHPALSSRDLLMSLLTLCHTCSHPALLSRDLYW